MRTQLTRSITLFDNSCDQAATADSPLPTGQRRTVQRWTRTLLLGTSFAVALCAPLLRHLH